MIQVYADGLLAYDSRVERYDLEKLKATTGLNIAGAADITMPPGHPAYNSFLDFRTVVEIYRDGELRFRGRALYPADDFYGFRTITCEGELCFLRDSVTRPYLYQASPADVFAAVIAGHNSQVEEFKQFIVGTVTVTDANDYIRFESENAERTMDTVNKLLDRCGGYIVFTTDETGRRVINWLEKIGTRSEQAIEFGENLLDFAKTGGSTSPATGLVPYGAKDETTGERVTIKSVNGGKDYILATDAQAIRGTIMETQTWDDVKEPANLLTKARAWLNENKVVVTTLTLTALDLSYMARDLNSFTLGDMIPVRSEPHGVDEDFQLTQLTEDFLSPADSTVQLGKDIVSLTGASVQGDRSNQTKAEEVVHILRTEMAQNVDNIAGQVAGQVEGSILLQVSNTYATQASVTSLRSDLMAQINGKVGAVELIASGSLGSVATLNLKVDGVTGTAQTFDLSKVRQAFAGDTSAVEISGGSVTFKTGTFAAHGAAFRDGATFETDALFTNGKVILFRKTDGKTDVNALTLTSSNQLIMGNTGCGTYIQSSGSVTIQTGLLLDKGNLTLRNSYGLRAYSTNGSAYFILSFNTGDQVMVGNADFPTYLRGTTVYLASTGAVVSSDQRRKNTIEDLPEAYSHLVDKLRPVRFKYDDGRSGRFHVGFVAQEVRDALEAAGLSSQDFGGFVDVNGDGEELGLAYDEFIGLLLAKINRLEGQLTALAGN